MSRPTRFYRLPCGCRVRWIRQCGPRRIYEQHPCQQHKTVNLKQAMHRFRPQTTASIDDVIEQLFKT